ncbi:MAG: DUF58 domain-containing protein [Deltaproteobacteria bacterium]|nr:DUF58 domain-containing protein [Deltaproteobacteria bacterium]
MSVGRSIHDEAQGAGRARLGLVQWMRLALLVISVLASVAVVWRWGLPRRSGGQAVVLGILAVLGSASGIAFAVRQWPERMGLLGRLSKRLDPNRRLTLTRDGRILVGITLAVGAAAVNTGNNFLYLVLGLLLALVSVSGVLSEWGLRDIVVCIEPGGDRFAGLPGLVAFHVFNQKASINSMSLEVSPILRPPEDAGGEPVKLPARFFMRLPPSSRHRGVVRADLPHRGSWEVLGFEVATAYPVGFFRKWKHEVPEAPEPRELLVFPSPAPVGDALRQIRLLVGERPGARAGLGDEFFSLRDHRPGDDVRRVAWKRSARTGRVLVREEEEPRGRVLTLVVPGGIQDATRAQREAYEQAHRVAAGIALALLEHGEEVGVLAGKRFVPPRAGLAAREGLLSALAVARLADELPPAPPEQATGTVVVVDGPGSLPPALVAHVQVSPSGVGAVTVRRAA